jgi:enoyl-CoA hydratase/carnithine racemase
VNEERHLVLTERSGQEGQVLWITFNRPKARNALTWEMYNLLEGSLSSAATDESGAGGSFVAGTDIAQFRHFRSEQDALEYERHGDRMFTMVETVGKPVIAAIDGPCTGTGFGLAACCDLRIGTRRSRYGLPIARTLGNCLTMASQTRLMALLGPARLKELVFRARLYSAEEAERFGFLNEVVDEPEALRAKVDAVAFELAGHAPLTLWATKEAIRRITYGWRPAEASDIVSRVYTSDDFREGVEAFISKRSPRWTGH